MMTTSPRPSGRARAIGAAERASDDALAAAPRPRPAPSAPPARPPRRTLRARAREAAILALAAALALGLLLSVALGEARRTHPHFLAEKLAAQGALMRAAAEPLLRAGLPLSQLPGMAQRAATLRASDPDLAAIAARGADGAEAFAVGAPDALAALREGSASAEDAWLRVELPLRSRFETVGALTLLAPRAAAERAIRARALPVAAAAAALGGAFVLVAATLGALPPARRWRLIAVGYGLCFSLSAAAVIAGLADLYAEGAQARARALSETLAQRVAPLLAYGLSLDDVSGLHETLAEYRALNPDILGAGLIVDDTVAVHTERSAEGAPWRSPPGALDYAARLDDAAVTVAVSLPTAVVLEATFGSVRNFAALFLASALIGGLAFGVARGLGEESEASPEAGDPRALALARPLVFVGVLAESASAGFMPQLLREGAAAAGYGEGWAAAPFAGYFAAFMLALLMGTAWSGLLGARRLAAAGAALAAAAAAIPAATPDVHALAASRLLAGLGQGALFVGAQAAVMAAAPAGRRTVAAAVMVFGFSGGMIAGAAIGALLVVDLGATGVFAVACVAAAALAVYAVATIDPAAGRARGAGLGAMLAAAPTALLSRRFVATLLLVGAPAKAVMTGVVAFAAPLMLSDRGWSAQDVGQTIMLYGAGVLLSSGPVAGWVDRRGDARPALAGGALAAALALALIAIGTPDRLSAALAPVAGAFLLGLAHGCVNAPAVTYAADPAAPDPAGAMSLYRVAERAGHVAGPALATAAIALAGAPDRGLVAIAVGTAVLALLFAAVEAHRR